MQPVHQNTSKLRAAQRKKQQNLLKKEKRSRRDPAIAASFKEAPHVRDTVRYGNLPWAVDAILVDAAGSGALSGQATNERHQLRFPAANGGSARDLGGYSGLLIGSMVPLGRCDALQVANHRGRFGAREQPFCRHQPITVCITGRRVRARCTMTAREQQHAR